jgi:hypothetical protein
VYFANPSRDFSAVLYLILLFLAKSGQLPQLERIRRCTLLGGHIFLHLLEALLVGFPLLLQLGVCSLFRVVQARQDLKPFLFVPAKAQDASGPSAHC